MDTSAVEPARAHAAGLSCRFEVAEVPPVPKGAFDVVLLLETLLAFPDQQTLLREAGTALAPGGRFAFTLEEGRPLIDAFVTEQSAIVAELGRGALDDLLAAHRLWSDWMTTGRVRKFVVAVKADGRRARR